MSATAQLCVSPVPANSRCWTDPESADSWGDSGSCANSVDGKKTTWMFKALPDGSDNTHGGGGEYRDVIASEGVSRQVKVCESGGHNRVSTQSLTEAVHTCTQ